MFKWKCQKRINILCYLLYAESKNTVSLVIRTIEADSTDIENKPSDYIAYVGDRGQEVCRSGKYKLLGGRGIQGYILQHGKHR